jgi:hypothetical protein
MCLLDDTDNYYGEHLKRLNNLPLYWDELKTKEQAEKIVKIVFQTSYGRSKGRMRADASLALVNTARTMLVIASNNGILGKVIKAARGTEAGGKRVFELETRIRPVQQVGAERMINALFDNYGVAGATYAEFLVKNKQALATYVKQLDEHLSAACQFTGDERFWRYTIVMLVAGAQIANTTGLTAFDVSAIQQLLVDHLVTMRQQMVRKQSYTLSTTVSKREVLDLMIAEIANKHLITTETVNPPNMMGQPKRLTPDEDFQRLQHVWMQKGVDDGVIMVRAREFEEWLDKHDFDEDQILEALKIDYTVTRHVRTMFGAGVKALDNLGTNRKVLCHYLVPKVPPKPGTWKQQFSHSPLVLDASSGSPAPKKPAS